MFSNIDIQDELVKTRQKHAQLVYSLKQQVDAALKKGVEVDDFILKRLKTAPKPGKWNINPELLDKNKLFSVDDIKDVCIEYRLRFLDSKYFKMEELPYDAVIAIKNLEKELGKEITHMKIVASAKYFKLEDVHKDPLLFAEVDENNYYLIHKWGNDFSWYKKWLSFPFRSVWSLLLTLIVIGLPLSFIIPAIVFHNPEDVSYYQMLYLAAFTVYTLFTMVFGGFTFYKKFSKVCWNTPYFN
jgi:hypothetical protein